MVRRAAGGPPEGHAPERRDVTSPVRAIVQKLSLPTVGDIISRRSTPFDEGAAFDAPALDAYGRGYD